MSVHVRESHVYNEFYNRPFGIEHILIDSWMKDMQTVRSKMTALRSRIIVKQVRIIVILQYSEVIVIVSVADCIGIGRPKVVTPRTNVRLPYMALN